MNLSKNSLQTTSLGQHWAEARTLGLTETSTLPDCVFLDSIPYPRREIKLTKNKEIECAVFESANQDEFTIWFD